MQDYIAFGYPSKKTVIDIIKKRGFIKKNDKRLEITDNNLIEELLGKFGIICLEDIIDSLVKCHKDDSHFNEIKEVIWPI